jgi:hypothetical protein
LKNDNRDFRRAFVYDKWKNILDGIKWKYSQWVSLVKIIDIL